MMRRAVRWWPQTVGLLGLVLLAGPGAASEPRAGVQIKTLTQGTRITGEGRFFTSVRVPVLDQDQVVRQCLPEGPCFSVLYHRERTGIFARRHSWTATLWNPGPRKISAKWSCHRHQEGYSGVTHRFAEEGLREYPSGPAAARNGFTCTYDNPGFTPEWIELGLEWVARSPPAKRRPPPRRPPPAPAATNR